ncbi:DNA-binding response regulator [Stagnimonas aquatica]|uniref:DNA-binding response regulator n=1 Tax=Stagnimonas aquatica TaxID=2689987 RepID=A0A3N0V2G5_9GAMM|nr:response regulator transcription factor [Stagnimonas aquatica]ROH86792.1 DNA-binding response regulator [Stagnimonas aquatica]
MVATICDPDENVFATLKRCSEGYVLKEQSKNQLADMLRAMVGGQPPPNPLSPREREVLSLIGKGYLNDQ